jgi:hypothetical protein
MKKKQVIPNLYPPAGHPHHRPPPPGRQDRPVPSSPPRALPHSPPHAPTAPSRTRRPMVAAPHPHRAARSSSPHAALISLPGAHRPTSPPARRRPARNGAGEDIRRRWGRGRRSAGDGPGEEILRRWGKGRIAAGRQGCSEVEARWLATGRRRHHLLFFGLTSGPLSSSAQIEFSLPAQHLQVGPTYQIWCQFASNSRSV